MARRRAGKRQVGYAVIGLEQGLGRLAQPAVLPAFAHARNARLVALVSADEETRSRLSRKHGCEAYATSDLDACLARPDVDAVYIAAPDDRHADLAVRCARAGVHVLCEKPLGLSEEECRRMIDACREAGVKLMTAYRLHFEPAHLAAVKLVGQGRIGEPRFFSSTCAHPVQPGNLRAGAGRGDALRDLGVSCIHAARTLFRADPVEVFAMRADRPGDPRFEEIHAGMSVLLRFPGDLLAQFSVSLGAYPQDRYRIVGTRGQIQLDQGYQDRGPRRLRLSTGGKERVRTFRAADQFGPELVAFSRAVLSDTPIEPDGEEGLRDVRVIAAALRSAREHRPLTLSWPAPHRHPEPADRIDRPRLREPRLVAVEAPTQ